MTREDMNAVVERHPWHHVYSSPMLEFHDRVSMGSGVTKDTMLLGVSPQYKQVRNLKVLGRKVLRRRGCSAAHEGRGDRAAVCQGAVWVSVGGDWAEDLGQWNSVCDDRGI